MTSHIVKMQLLTIKLAMCCDPCKCQVCDRRNNGTKSMLKPVTLGTTSFGPPPSAVQNFTSNTRFQTTSNTVRPAMITQGSDSTTSTREQWEAYANEGVQADDAEVLQKKRQQEAQFLRSIRTVTPSTAGPPSASARLVEISPDKVARSMHTDLLLDLEEATDASGTQGRHHTQDFSYTNAASLNRKAKDEAQFNLLD